MHIKLQLVTIKVSKKKIWFFSRVPKANNNWLKHCSAKMKNEKWKKQIYELWIQNKKTKKWNKHSNGNGTVIGGLEFGRLACNYNSISLILCGYLCGLVCTDCCWVVYRFASFWNGDDLVWNFFFSFFTSQ